MSLMDERRICVLEELISIPKAEVILKAMKCSLCSKVPTPDVYSCEAGHPICISCSRIVVTCPHQLIQDNTIEIVIPCARKFNKMRNQLFTDIYNNSMISCTNEGCPKMIKGSGLTFHARNCKYTRNVVCQFRHKCRMREIPFEMFEQHMSRAHNVKLIESSRYLCPVVFELDETGSMVKYMFSHCKQTFSLVMNRYGGMIYIFVSLMKALPDIHERFYATIQLVGNGTAQRIYHGQVGGYGERALVMDTEDCITVSVEDVRSEHLIRDHKNKEILFVDVFIQAVDRTLPNLGKWESYLESKIVEVEATEEECFNVGNYDPQIDSGDSAPDVKKTPSQDIVISVSPFLNPN